MGGTDVKITNRLITMLFCLFFFLGACSTSNIPTNDALNKVIMSSTPKQNAISTTLPIESTTFVQAATRTTIFTQTSTPIAPMNRFDHASVLYWLIRAIDHRDAAIFSQLVKDNIGYGNHLEGGQIVSKQKFLSDLDERFPSNPKCESYVIMDQNHIQVWTSGWTPAWQLTEMCYVNGCNPINPPFQNNDAGFFLAKIGDGWIIQGMELIDAKKGEKLYNLKTYSCDSISPLDTKAPTKMITTTPFVCSSIFKTRLKVGDYAYISTDPPYPLRVRKNPGKAGLVVNQLQPGQGLVVLDGPSCTEGLVWWKVRSLNGTIEGWVAEGETNDYWLIPCSSSILCGSGN